MTSTTTPVRRSGTSTNFDSNPGSAPLWLSVRRPHPLEQAGVPPLGRAIGRLEAGVIQRPVATTLEHGVEPGSVCSRQPDMAWACSCGGAGRGP